MKIINDEVVAAAMYNTDRKTRAVVWDNKKFSNVFAYINIRTLRAYVPDMCSVKVFEEWEYAVIDSQDFTVDAERDAKERLCRKAVRRLTECLDQSDMGKIVDLLDDEMK